LAVSWRTSWMNFAGLVLAMRCYPDRGHILYVSLRRPGRSGGARTPSPRFWRPVLYQLSYTPIPDPGAVPPRQPSPSRIAPSAVGGTGWGEGAAGDRRSPYLMILATTPAPTVRPPSRMAKRRPSSIAIGAINCTSIEMLSPGITISVPAGSTTVPVTSVVRK
jgi:hypothetical protein